MKPLAPEVIDHCQKEAVRVRDILIKAADAAAPEPLRKSSVLVTMLEIVCMEAVMCVGHDREGCARAWGRIVRDVAAALDGHFDESEHGH